MRAELHQWEIVILEFPFSDLTNTKSRPVLILSNDHYNRISNSIVVAQITSNLDSGFSDYNIEFSEEDVILYPGAFIHKSLIKPYAVFTAHKKLVKKIVGRLKEEKVEEVKDALRRVFSL